MPDVLMYILLHQQHTIFFNLIWICHKGVHGYNLVKNSIYCFMYIGNRLTGLMASAFSNYVTHLVIIIIRILECQLFFTHILHFFVNCESVFGKYRPLMSLLEIPSGYDLAPGSAPRPCRCSRHFSIFRRKDFFYFLRRIITLSNLKQCSGDNPYIL